MGQYHAEGIHLGIIGFNQHLYEKEIGLLNTSTKSSYTSHIDALEMKNGTGLYWADNTAIKRLKSYGEPPKLTNVALVTFTDGLDNVSLDDNETNPENYPTKEAYLAGLSEKIRQNNVHGLNINAYTIGLRGSDVNDLEEFHANLKKLASKDDNAFEVSDMSEALQRFTEIAESLHSVSNTASLSLLIPSGYNDGTIVRFTFDNIPSSSTAVENSNFYIECTYKKENNGRRLENIMYRGWQTGASSVSSIEKVDRYYKIVFDNLTKSNGDLVSNDDKRYVQLFYKTSSGEWQKDSEFKPDTFSDIIEEQSSALIMLVLDCTTSLDNDFSNMKTAAKRFVETLVSSNGGGNNGGGNGGGGNGGGNGSEVPTYLPAPTGLSSSVSGSRIKITWNSVPQANGYKIYKRMASWGGDYYYYNIDNISTTTYYDSNPYLDNYYKVRAIYSDPSQDIYVESELSSHTYCSYGGGGK